jgi:glycosyltransferase involved in cell wall biosynthesis
LLIVSFSVCPAPDRHGVQLLNVLKALAPRYQVDVLTLRNGALPFHERFMKTRMLRVPVGAGTLAEKVEAFRRAIRRQLEGEEYEVVHLRSAWGGRAVLAGSSGKLVYEIARSTEGEPRAADAALSQALAAEEQLCLERADLVLVPTEAGRAHLQARGLGERVAVVPPGVDVDHFDWEPAVDDDGVPRVLYAGQIAAGRGVRTLVRAVGMVRRRRPVKLVLAGSVEEAFAPQLEQALGRAGLGPGDVERLGPIEHDDMPRVMALATICVAPQAPDEAIRPLSGFPSKLLEYMACRRPVVAPRRSAVQEIVSEGESGLLFAPGDEQDLARAISRLVDDVALRDQLADVGYRRVRQRHPASATRRRLLEVYAPLLPADAWAPPQPAASPIDALPPHPDTTTARRPLPAPFAIDARDTSERSGEIVIDHVMREPPVPSHSVVIEINAEPMDPDERDAIEGAIPLPALDDKGEDDDLQTRAFVARRPGRRPAYPSLSDSPFGFDGDEPDEKTQPRPLRPRKESG